MKRQDLSLVAIAARAENAIGGVDEFCKERLDLEIQATPEIDYYAASRSTIGPVRAIAWLVVGLVAGAGVFAGLNTMYGAVVGPGARVGDAPNDWVCAASRSRWL